MDPKPPSPPASDVSPPPSNGGRLTSKQVEEAKLGLSQPQNSAGLTVLKREIETEPVDPAIARRVSKSRAQKVLRTAFNEARFQSIDPPPGTPEGHQTWQLWCKGSYGRLVAIVEVTASPEVLPYSIMREAFKRIGREVIVTAASISTKPLPKPATP